MNKDKGYMQMLRELLAKEENPAEDEPGNIRIRVKDGSYTVGNEFITAFGPRFWDSYTADTLEHAIEKAWTEMVKS